MLSNRPAKANKSVNGREARRYTNRSNH